MAAVARSAGVSPTAVSLVLSGRAGDYRLSDRTSARVLAAVASLGYVRPARRRGPPRLHVLHLEDILRMDTRGLGGAVLYPLLDALSARGWATSVDPRMPDDAEAAGPALFSATAMLLPVNRGFEARSRALAEAAAVRGVQPVIVARHLDDLDAIQIDGDQRRGGALAAAHLLGLGHRRIAVLGGSLGEQHTEERLAGWYGAMAAAGLHQDPSDFWGYGDYNTGPAHHVVSERLAAGMRPTAIFCCNDPMAVGALLALREAGLRVPQDVSLVGFDDQPDLTAIAPGITSIRIDTAGIGERVADMLVAGAPVRSERILCAARLVVRGSSTVAPRPLPASRVP